LEVFDFLIDLLISEVEKKGEKKGRIMARGQGKILGRAEES
jgi:hypothetical protein